MGAGYYPLGGVLARQGRGRAMRNYEPNLCKKQPATIIKLPAPCYSSMGFIRRIAPARGSQRLLGPECLPICISSTIFTLAAHP